MNKSAILLLFSFLLLPCLISGQAQQGEYIKIDYLFVEPENADQFLGDAQMRWKEQMESEIASEEITGWYMYKVSYSASRDDRYNYVIVTSANSLSSFETPEGMLSGESPEIDDLMPLRSMVPGSVVHSELWKVQNSIARNGSFTPSRFKVMDYMNVNLGREYEYQMFEDEVARPLHEDRMEMDRMNAWEVYQLIIPGGINYGYNFSTGNYFNSLDHIEFGFTDEMIRANHPDVNLMEFFEAIFSARDLVQSDLWELISYAREEASEDD